MKLMGWGVAAAMTMLLLLPGGTGAQSAAPGADSGSQPTSQQWQTIRTAGYNAGFRDGVTDYRDRTAYDFKGHPVYQNPEQSFAAPSGLDGQTVATDFRTGYEAGYDDGYYGRSSNPSAERQRDYSAPLNPSTDRNRAAAQPGSNASAAGTLPAGTTLDVNLNNTISTSSSQAGDSFAATVTAPVNGARGEVLVPVGSTVTGTIGAVQRSGSLSGNSQIQLNIKDLTLPGGTRLPLRAEVSQITSQGGVGGAITGSPSTTSEGGVEQSQTRNTAGSAAAGGAAGLIIGAIAGGGKGAGIGGLVGAGLGAVLASRNGNLTLPAGTGMIIKLDQPINIR